MRKLDCLFCQSDDSEKNKVFAENDFAYARWDNFPVSAGHAEIVPKDHIESFFDLSEEQLIAVHSLSVTAKQIIANRYNPDAFTIGVNDGEMAGRTVHHLHIHLIPRYKGDVANPRGGVRHIIPSKGDY